MAQGIVRMRWREKKLMPTPMVAGEKYEVEIDMWSTCWIIKKGHKLGVDIASASSYLYLPNPNTGLPLEPKGAWPQGGERYTGKNVTATNTLFYGASKITLPVVELKDLPMSGPVVPDISASPSQEELIQLVKDHQATLGESHGF